MKYLSPSLLLINLELIISHSSHHSSHTSHTSHFNHKSFNINKNVPISILSLIVFNDFTSAVNNDFEKNKIYRVFNISSITSDNLEDCIYYNTYLNKNNETLIISIDNILSNYTFNIKYLNKFCKKNFKNSIILMNLYYLFVLILFICFCCMYCCNTYPYNNRTINMY